MTNVLHEDLLDDPDGIVAADPGSMLREVAAAPAQLREAAFTAAEVDLSATVDGGRPRALVVAGMGGSGVSGDVLGAVAGPGAPVPVIGHKSYGLPGWVGPADIVVAVSCSGTTEETLSAAEEAVRRGCRVVGVGGAGSPLAVLVEQGRGTFLTVPGGRMPRASIWALSVPLLTLADALGIAHAPRAVLDDAADLLETLSDRYAADRDSFVNPAKSVALGLAERLPVLWGSSALAGVAAYRMSTQLNENAKVLGVPGVLPEANHNQVVAYDGPDPAEQLALVLLRDSEEHEQVARRVEVSAELARERGIPVHEITAEGGSRLARLASLIAFADFTSVYLGLLLGFDPSPIGPIDELKARIKQ